MDLLSKTMQVPVSGLILAREETTSLVWHIPTALHPSDTLDDNFTE